MIETLKDKECKQVNVRIGLHYHQSQGGTSMKKRNPPTVGEIISCIGWLISIIGGAIIFGIMPNVTTLFFFFLTMISIFFWIIVGLIIDYFND